MNGKQTELVVVEKGKLRLLLVLAAAAALVAAWAFYRLGMTDDGAEQADEIAALRAERALLRQRVDALEMRNEEMERKLAMIESSRRIDAEAYALYTQERSGLEEQIRGLEEELAIYRGILSPERNKVGLEAQNFEVKPALGTQRYRYSFMLTQGGTKNPVARGMLRLTLEGLQDGKPRQLGLADLSENGNTDIAYRFRYFQVIKGVLQLPEGFQPERIALKAIPASAPKLPLEWAFDWPLGTGDGTERK